TFPRDSRGKGVGSRIIPIGTILRFGSPPLCPSDHGLKTVLVPEKNCEACHTSDAGQYMRVDNLTRPDQRCTAKEIIMRRFQTFLNGECLEERQLLTAYSAAQIRHAYGFDQWGLDGSGQTIAIVAPYDHPNIADDLKIFDQEFGLPDPPQFTKVNQDGGTTFPKVANTDWSREIALDVEWAHAIGPGANILLVEANSDSPADIYSAVDYARHQAG